MTWYAIIGVAATVSLLLPIAAITTSKLFQHRSLAALLLVYIIRLLSRLMQQQVVQVSFAAEFETAISYLKIPLMLLALLFFCPIKQRQRVVYIILGVFATYEVIIALLFQLRPEAVVFLMGPGLALIMVYTFYLFAKHIKMTVEFGKNAGRTLMLAAILFDYGSYSLVYHFNYIQKAPDVADAFLLYAIFICISCALMALGIMLVKKRIKELTEVKKTRRELATFFEV